MVWAGLGCALTTSAQPFDIISSFGNAPANPRGNLTLGPDGYFYGTTAFGGQYGEGAVFRVTTNGNLMALASFGSFLKDGNWPFAGLTLGPDGNFYGTTATGGTNQISGTNNTGTIFRLTTNGALATVASFTGFNGSYPECQLIIGLNGNFYGTTAYGGVSNVGTVFQVTTNGVLTTLASFSGTNGAMPQAGLTLGLDGNFYGTTTYGGISNVGTIFQVTPGGDLTTLVNFNTTNGALPYGQLRLGADGDLYGTTSSGGISSGSFQPTTNSSVGYFGTVFRVTTAGTLTTLADLTFFEDYGGLYSGLGGPIGWNPYGQLIQGADGDFYGTTSGGGTNGSGTIFKVSTNGTLAQLASLPNLQYQFLTNFLGFVLVNYTTNNFTNSSLTLLLNASVKKLYDFPPLVNTTNSTGAYSHSGLTLGPDGNFYTAVYQGGASGYGTVIRVTTNGTVTPLASFSGNPGSGIRAGLTLGPDGSLYGATQLGGVNGIGTLFKWSRDGTLSTLHSFSYRPDGANPNASLTLGPDGNLYGTTINGGTNVLQTGTNSYSALSYGTVFRVTTNGAFTPVVYFNSTNGANPYDQLTLLGDGNFYGTTAYGGISNLGTVFQVTTNGALTTLASFTGDDGSRPYGKLALGPNGHLYGMTGFGGISNVGTVFEISTQGVLNTLVHFTRTNGANPQSGLLWNSDGYFYGVTESGGTIFKLTPGGALTTLVNFGQTNGYLPSGELIKGPDGNLYGATSQGGTGFNGTVFRLNTDGTLTTLFSFPSTPLTGSFSSGYHPYSGLTLFTNGNVIHLFGTAFGGGSYGGGTIFRVNLTTYYAVTENTSSLLNPLTNDVMWTTGGSLSLVGTSTTNGTATINGTGIQVLPATNFVGSATLAYTFTDGTGQTNTSLIALLVTNIPPVANPDSATVVENSSANSLNPLANDLVQTPGGTLGLMSVTTTNGTAVISGSNVLFTPDTDYAGAVTLNYTVTDHIGGTNSSFIAIQVNAPVITNTVSTLTIETNLIASASQQTTNFSTRLIAVMPGGTVEFDQTFPAAFLDAPVQSAIVTAAGKLATAGAVSYVGPTQTSSLQTPNGNSSMVVTNFLGTNVLVVTNEFIGPTNIFVGIEQSQLLVLPEGNIDFDILTTTIFTNLITTTVTSNYLASSVYVMTGVLASVTLDCSTNMVLSTDPGQCSRSNVTYTVTFSGDGATLTQTAGLPSGATFPAGITTNSFTVTDTNGNSSACSFTVKIYETELPMINCPGDMVLPTDSTGVMTRSNVTFNVAFSDNCPGAILTQTAGLPSGATLSVGVITNRFTVTDASGNTNTCSFTITVSQTNRTTTTASFVEYDSLQTTTVTQRVDQFSTRVIGRIAGGAIVFDQTFTNAFSNSVVQAALAQATNALTGAGAGDITGPTMLSNLQALANSVLVQTNLTNVTQTVGLNETIGPANILVGNFGVVDGYTLSNDYATVTGSYTGNPHSFRVAAEANNFDVRTLTLVERFQTNTTADTYLTTQVYELVGTASSPLTLNCSTNIILSTDPGECSRSNVTYTVTFSGDGATLTQTAGLPSGSTFAKGVTTNSFMASDTNGNSTACSFTVTINDTELPMIICSSNIVAPIDLGQTYTSNVTYSVMFSDNCPGAVLTQTAGLPSGSTFPLGITTNSFTVTDAAGNTNTCSFTVTIIPRTTTTTSLVEFDTLQTTSVTQRVDQFSTRLIGRIAGGAIVFDQTFTNAYSNSVVQNALVQATNALTGAGAATITGPTVLTNMQALTNSVTVQTGQTNSSQIVGYNETIGPATILIGDFGIVQSYVLSNDYAIVTGSFTGNPQSFDVLAGTSDIDFRTLTLVDRFQTNTTTDTYLTTQIYELIGTLPVLGSNLVAEFVYSPMTLNRQTGLFEQQVRLRNLSAFTVDSARVYVLGLPSTNTLYNRSGASIPTGLITPAPYAQYNQPLPSGSNAVLLLEFYIPNLKAITNHTLLAEGTIAAPPPAVPAGAQQIALTPGRDPLQLASGRFLIEWVSIPGRSYLIQYSSDMTNWKTVVPSTVAAATATQWIDDGPPKTETKPNQAGGRFYRVFLLPAN